MQLYDTCTCSLGIVWYSEVPPGYLILVLNFLFCLKKMWYEVQVLLNGGNLRVKVSFSKAVQFYKRVLVELCSTKSEF